MAEDSRGNRSGTGAASILPHIAAEAADPKKWRATQTVLVVDDMDGQRYAMARRLKEDGFKTIEAACGRDAIAMAAAATAVVLDVNLPDINGVEVCRALKAARPSLPVVLVSAVYDGELHRIAAATAGADAYLAPPPTSPSLTATIDRLLQ
ncbi:response regulator transcription factor [Ramlibacter sp. Leaf400]|uniref:response regulator transcription factor n=1 Tax=Ramlibacter sp. Leaf400 TaxID=1736365 RepID=UPI0006FD8EF9|nr:response regulator [Ramlibacter sp. Leaf400]KQT11288.1 hypothetical protein ASG30_05255 [Ramlibacter sp. Leaf400]